MALLTKTFFLSRLNKIGYYHDRPELVIQALRKSNAIIEGRFGWAILNLREHSDYIYGHLCKFELEGASRFVDLESRNIRVRMTENEARAASEFLYIPQYSGVAYHPVHPDIPHAIFTKRLPEVMTTFQSIILARLEIEPITDLRRFASRVKGLTDISKIHATVRPPNPSYSPLWKEIREYLRKRKVSELTITEESTARSIDSKIPHHISQVIDNVVDEIEPAELADAAILMAADGYGEGFIDGRRGNKKERVWTSRAQLSFKIRSEAEHSEIFEAALPIFQKIAEERRMMH